MQSHDAFLQGLAITLEASGGPIDEMDGSPESLIALWKWARAYAKAGYPAIASNVESSRVAFVPEAFVAQKSYLLSEMVGHYLLVACQFDFPQAKLVVSFQRPTFRKNEPYRNELDILKAKGTCRRVLTYVNGAIDRANEGRPTFASELALFELVRGTAEPRTDASGKSLLVPLLPPTTTLIPVPPMPRFEIDASPTPPTAPAFNRRESELAFTSIGADLEELGSAAPLDISAVTTTLDGLGFVSKGGASPLNMTFRDGLTELNDREQSTIAALEVVQGSIRAVHIEFGTTSNEDHDSTRAAFEKLGRQIGARLSPA
jgi:hypothetical protein